METKLGMYHIGIYAGCSRICDNHGKLIYNISYVYSVDGKLNYYKDEYSLSECYSEKKLILYANNRINHPLQITRAYVINMNQIFLDIPKGEEKLIEDDIYSTTSTKEYIDKIKENEFSIFNSSDWNDDGWYEDVRIKNFRLYIKTKEYGHGKWKYEEKEYDCFDSSEQQLITLFYEIHSLENKNASLVNIPAFPDEQFIHEFYIKFKEIKEYVDNIDIDDVCNKYKLSCKFHYITKIGGDDRLYVDIETSDDPRRDTYISSLLPKWDKRIWEDKGYCNLYSHCNCKELEEKTALLEKEGKENLKKLYNKSAHISKLCYDFVSERFQKAANVEYTKLSNSIQIQKYWNWIYQNCSLKEVPYYLAPRAEAKRGFDSVLAEYNSGESKSYKS